MPLELKPPRKGHSPNWTIRGTYLGQYVDRSARTSKRAVAAKILAGIERQIERGAYAEPGEPTFASAAASYMKAGGERTYLKKLLEHFGDTPLREIGQAEIDRAASILHGQSTPATRNRSVYTPVSAVLRHAGARLDLRRPKGAGGNKATAWLWPEQAEALFQEAHKIDARFAALLITLCYTGMRLSEALGLTWNDVRLDDGFAYVGQTKNDEPRAIFLPPVAVAALQHHAPRELAESKRVFALTKSGHLYSLLKACAFRAGVDLPERSAFHIFRHTYATWMRRYAGADEQSLIATGAWKDAKSVKRYTHTIINEEARRAELMPGARSVPKAS